jgi:hypothetical protein
VAPSGRGAPAATGKRTAAKPAAGAKPAGRSPSTLRNLIREADKELARLERERTKLEAELVAAAEAVDHEALTRLGAALADVQARQAAAEERWLELGTELEG